MTVLADLDFESLKVGMKFTHPEYGEQIVLELSRGQFGPVIRFHNCKIYSGELPRFGEDEGELDIFQALASQIYPSGAELWESAGIVSQSEIEHHGWKWWRVACPHCGFVHQLLSAMPEDRLRQCRECGMQFSRPIEQE